MSNNTQVSKSAEERDSLDLLELVCQLHSRALNYPSKEMHDAYITARQELEKRLLPTQYRNQLSELQVKGTDFVFTEPVGNELIARFKEKWIREEMDLDTDVPVSGYYIVGLLLEAIKEMKHPNTNQPK